MQLNLTEETFDNIRYALTDAIKYQLRKGIDTHNSREALDILNDFSKNPIEQPKGDQGSDYDK